MTAINNISNALPLGNCNETNVLRGQVVSLDRILADGASIDRCKKTLASASYKYDPCELPDFVDANMFNKHECNNGKEVATLQHAVKCLKALDNGPTDTSILDEYANDTLLTFDYATGKTLFDDETFQKDLKEHKNKQRALVDEHNKIVASTNLTNAIENAKKIQQIKSKIAELQATPPKKDDAKYNHPEIVQGNISVKQVLDRYTELRDLRHKFSQEWKQYELDYRHSNARKLGVSEETFRVFKELYKADIFVYKTSADVLFNAAAKYDSVKDFDENGWKDVRFDENVESRKFLNQKQLNLWQKYGDYTSQFQAPRVDDWMMYEHFNDNDLMWLRALTTFNERVTALKRIEAQSK